MTALGVCEEGAKCRSYVAEFMEWPARLASTLWEESDVLCAERRRRFKSIMSRTPLQLLSDFSGMGGPEQAFQEIISAAIVNQKMNEVHACQTFRACDVNRDAQRMLLDREGAHLFQNLFDRLPDEARQAMTRFQNAGASIGCDPRACHDLLEVYLRRRQKLIFAASDASCPGCLRHPDQRPTSQLNRGT